MDVVVVCIVIQTIIIGFWWSYWMHEKNYLDNFWKIEIPGCLVAFTWVAIPATILFVVFRWVIPWALDALRNWVNS